MIRPSRLLPLVNVAFFLAVAITFVAGHGGWPGEVPIETGVQDVVTPDDGIVIFNKWRFVAHQEAFFTKSFLLLNSPAFFASQLCMRVLRSKVAYFKESTSPFGLSDGTYSILLALLLSMIQWFGIGTIYEALQKQFWRKSGATCVRSVAFFALLLSGCNLMAEYPREIRASSSTYAYDGFDLASRDYGEPDLMANAASLDSHPGFKQVQTRLLKPSPRRFTGKERDAETGLDYFGARHFAGGVGRFTSADAPFADQHAEDPQSWNLYAYVRNNPLRFIDPSGRECVAGVSSEDSTLACFETTALSDVPIANQYFSAAAAGVNRAAPYVQTLAAATALMPLAAVAIAAAVPAAPLVVPVAAATTGAAETPQGQQAIRRGIATVSQYATASGPHFSVEVSLGAQSVATEQVIINSATRATTIALNTSANAIRSVTVALPDAQSALNYSRQVLGTNTGPYNAISNSCLSHCGNVLNAGGLGVPLNSTMGTAKFLKPLF